MAAVHSRGNTTTELPLGKLLWAANLRGYRKHWPVLGKPDFAWPGRKVAVFVDGCFWHGCETHGTWPAINRHYWQAKISGNILRDRRVDDLLAVAGWKSIRVWEHEPASGAAIRIHDLVRTEREEPPAG